MIRLNIRHIARLKGIDHTYSFLTANGFTHHTAKQLSSGSVKRLHFRHLEKLCRIFACEPHDLYDYETKMSASLSSSDHLAFLKKSSASADIQAIIRSLPLKELENLVQDVSERYKRA